MTEVDQGWGYELAAVLGPADLLAGPARALAPAPTTPLHGSGLALLPVTGEIADRATPAALCALDPDPDGHLPGGTRYSASRRSGLLTGPESGFQRLTPGLAALAEAASIGGTLAYVEADYQAREGRQAAVVWRYGRLLTGPLLLGPSEAFDPETAPVSVALRALGVLAAGRRDEFLVAGLDRHRSTAEWAAGP